MFDRWNNAPWTPRGLKFKHTVEIILGFAILILLCCEPTSWQS
jgi:hypothetical protein